MTTIPDHVGREAVRLLAANNCGIAYYQWPKDSDHPAVITVAKLLVNPPERMTDPDEEAAKRVLDRVAPLGEYTACQIAAAKEQMRLERQAWEAGR